MLLTSNTNGTTSKQRHGKGFVWVNQAGGGRNGLPAGSQLTRHLQRVANISRKPRKTVSVQLDNTSRKASQHVISLSDTGGVVFLNTRQEDYDDSDSDADSFHTVESPPLPFMAFDTVCTPVSTIDTGMKTVFRYITTAWLPSSDSIPVGGLFGAFSPVWPGDEKIANDFLSSALQSSNDLSLFCMLTIGARRMARLTQMLMEDRTNPDYYTMRAIQSLRSTIVTQGFDDDQLILNLTFLVLAEIYLKSPAEVKGLPVYWSMIRDCIIQCGGFHQIRPQVLRFVMSMDGLFAGSQLTLPQLNLLRHPELMGHGTGDLDQRSQSLCLILQQRSETIEAIQNLPGDAPHAFSAFIRTITRQIIKSFSTPLLPKPHIKYVPKPRPEYTHADILYTRARANTINTWYWVAAINYVSPDLREGLIPPAAVDMALEETCQMILEVLRLLDGKEWFASPDMVLWMSVVALAVVDRLTESQDACRRLCVDAARQLGVASLADLLEAVKLYLPIQSLDLGRLEGFFS